MRPTKIILKARELSPVIQPRALNATPLTMPVEDPQLYYCDVDLPLVRHSWER